MRYLVALLFLSFASSVFADSAQPQFLLLRQRGKVILLAGDQPSIEMTGSPPTFCWEGPGSRATFTNTTEGVSIEFKLDIIGPDWLYVTLDQTHDGVQLSTRRTNSDGSDDASLDTRKYPSYAALLNDPDYSEAVCKLLCRYGQNPAMPDVSCLRTPVFGLEPPANARLEKECAELIARLDDDSWHVRDAATRRLEEPAVVQHALAVARLMKLTPEQRARIDGIASEFHLDIQGELLDQLASLALSQDDIAMLSE